MISRRAFTAAAAAIPAGVAGGLYVRRWTGSNSTLALLGRDQSIFALLDTGDERALFVLGNVDTYAAGFLPELLTIGNSRVDLVVASHEWLITAGMRTTLGLDTTRALSIQSDIALPPVRGEVTPIIDHQRLSLGPNCTIDIQVVPDVSRESSDPLFVSSVTKSNVTIVLTNSEEAIEIGPQGAQMLVIPGDVSSELLERVSPSIFVGTASFKAIGIVVMQTHLTEPIHFRIGNGELAKIGS